MPRPNQPRSIASEANVAERITLEREKRELSYEALAKLMTDAGCSMVGSAIFRIEKGNPRRHITVDELVAFAEVFGTSVPNLLAPVDLVRSDHARELVEQTLDVWKTLPAAAAKLYGLAVEFYKLSQSDPELYEFFQYQWMKAAAELLPVPLPADVGPALKEFTEIVLGRAAADAQDQIQRAARSTSRKRSSKATA
jgi:transcriptional regulator with XRE-family HTH domain